MEEAARREDSTAALWEAATTATRLLNDRHDGSE